MSPVSTTVADGPIIMSADVINRRHHGPAARLRATGSALLTVLLVVAHLGSGALAGREDLLHPMLGSRHLMQTEPCGSGSYRPPNGECTPCGNFYPPYPTTPGE